MFAMPALCATAIGSRSSFAKKKLWTKRARRDHRQQSRAWLVVDTSEGSDLKFGVTLKPEYEREVLESALTQNMTTLHNRVNELGVAEPVIQRQGADRIVVQLPGVQDTAKAKEILGRTATLEARLVDLTQQAARGGAGRSAPCRLAASCSRSAAARRWC